MLRTNPLPIEGDLCRTSQLLPPWGFPGYLKK